MSRYRLDELWNVIFFFFFLKMFYFYFFINEKMDKNNLSDLKNFYFLLSSSALSPYKASITYPINFSMGKQTN